MRMIAIDQNAPTEAEFLAEMLQEYYAEGLNAGLTPDEAEQYAILMVKPNETSNTATS